jgi:hypothetical protein
MPQARSKGVNRLLGCMLRYKEIGGGAKSTQKCQGKPETICRL